MQKVIAEQQVPVTNLKLAIATNRRCQFRIAGLQTKTISACVFWISTRFSRGLLHACAACRGYAEHAAGSGVSIHRPVSFGRQSHATEALVCVCGSGVRGSRLLTTSGRLRPLAPLLHEVAQKRPRGNEGNCQSSEATRLRCPAMPIHRTARTGESGQTHHPGRWRQRQSSFCGRALVLSGHMNGRSVATRNRQHKRGSLISRPLDVDREQGIL